MTQRSEPIFNVPAAVIAVIVVCVLVHLARTYLLTGDEEIDFLLTFAFIPARYDPTIAVDGALPGGWGADIWTFFSYAFIHGDAMHLGVNTVWLLPFGSAVARRFGSLRFIAFFAVTAAAGAAMHLATHQGAVVPMIGASAAISGFMAAAIRFAFQHGGPLSMFRTGADAAYRVPAAPLTTALRDVRIIAFLAAWFGVNVLFGLGSLAIPGLDQAVAWEAHIGGFLAGLVLFALFDPIVAHADADGSPGPGSEPTVH